MSNKEQRRAEIMALLKNGSIYQKEAAERLGLSVRHIRRIQRAFEKSGAEALVSKKRGKPSNRKLSELLTEQIISRIRERYSDFGPTLAHEKLKEEDGFDVSLSAIRRIMVDAKIWFSKKIKAPTIHARRERRPRFGELVQIDGSNHEWFEKRADRCCLIVLIDDATSSILGLHFAPSESMRAYFETMAPYFRECGRPVAVYSDKHGIFRVNKGSTMETSVTQFGRAMKQLDIGTICAHSPQAKGRVERANGTLQDRLVKELRLKGISTIEEANAFLPQFQKDYNRRFAVPASDPIDAHRTLMSHNLECILSVLETRKVSKSLSFQYENTHYQILEEGWRAKQLIGQRITIVSTLSNETRVFFRDTELTYTRAELVPQRPKAVDSKELNAEMRKWLNKKPQYRPPITHPYKKRKNF